MGKFFVMCVAVLCIGYSTIAFGGSSAAVHCDFSNPKIKADPGWAGTVTSVVMQTASMNFQLHIAGGHADLKKSDADVRLCYRNAMKVAHDTSVGSALELAYAKYLIAFQHPTVRSVKDFDDSIAGVKAAAGGYVVNAHN